MNIAVIGATGNTGFAFVRQALDHGHHVTVLARSPEKLTLNNPNLTVIKGDVLNAAEVKQAVLGKDAVFIALGAKASAKTTIRTDGTRQVVNLLEAANEKPLLVIISSLGVNESMKQLPAYLRPLLKLMLGRVFADHAMQEAVVKASSLPYVFLRPTTLSDDHVISALQATPAPQIVNSRPAVSRASVAAFALTTIEKPPRQSYAVTLTSG